MPIRAVAFDLGGTLVDYYRVREFPPILAAAITAVHQVSGAALPLADALRAAPLEGSEQRSGAVTPLAARLARILQCPVDRSTGNNDACARAFLAPIFALARVYPDTLETLAALRAAGYRIAIVSNTPWGSPAQLWREELARLGLARAVDASIFCTDVGWRKPARPIFDAALDALAVPAAECAFVGDHPEWDSAGAQAAGLFPILLDRTGEHPNHPGVRIQSLTELLRRGPVARRAGIHPGAGADASQSRRSRLRPLQQPANITNRR